ncbi:MAG: hydrogenase 4 subunit F [Bacillota bacterium]|nr:MAG: hydrogenase 4 subunit F [Bacillota bacterium]
MMGVDAGLLLYLLAVPLVTALLAFLLKSRRLVEGLHVLGTALLCSLSLRLVTAVSGGRLLALHDLLHADQLSALLVFIIGVMGFLVGLYSVGYMRQELEGGETDEPQLSSYYGLFHLFLFTMVLSALANNLALLWVAVEATTLASAFLVGHHRRQTAAEGAWKYVLLCSIGLAFALYGTILTYVNAFSVLGDAHRALLWTELARNAGSLDPQLMKLAFVFILIGFGTKAGLFPMHTWLPDAHSEAPSPASALLSGVLLKSALVGIMRYYSIASQAVPDGFAQRLLLVFGLLTVCAGALFILVQPDLKRKLAYSSIEHVGVIATGLGVGGPLGVFAALFHTLNHSVTKSVLFCTAGTIGLRYGTRDTTRIRGVLKVMPLTGAMFLAGVVAAAGSPPFGIFLSEFTTIAAGLGNGQIASTALLIAGLLIAFVALVLLVSETVFGPAPDDPPRGDGNALMTIPVGVLVALMAVLVLLPGPLHELVYGAVAVVLQAR